MLNFSKENMLDTCKYLILSLIFVLKEWTISSTQSQFKGSCRRCDTFSGQWSPGWIVGLGKYLSISLENCLFCQNAKYINVNEYQIIEIKAIFNIFVSFLGEKSTGNELKAIQRIHSKIGRIIEIQVNKPYSCIV